MLSIELQTDPRPDFPANASMMSSFTEPVLSGEPKERPSFRMTDKKSALRTGSRWICPVPVTRVAEIVHGRRTITAETALRLSRYFNTSAHFWLNLPVR